MSSSRVGEGRQEGAGPGPPPKLIFDLFQESRLQGGRIRLRTQAQTPFQRGTLQTLPSCRHWCRVRQGMVSHFLNDGRCRPRSMVHSRTNPA